MKLILFIFIVFIFCTSSSPIKDCKCKGIFLGGRVDFIRDSSKADFKIRVARFDEDRDIAVSFMNSPTKECGEWHVIRKSTDSVDFTVCYVDSNEDFTIDIFPDPNAVVPWEELEINRARTSTSTPGSTPNYSSKKGFSSSDCSCNGIPLYGKVQVVDALPDFEVQVVNSSANLNVQVVNSSADRCGQWQFVNSLPDFTIRFVKSLPDFTIKYVDHTP